ncbi:hypothetical protein [Bacteroides acidifaciens]|uniref:hypothetical protein n=1 Tax=Bacteroides acidifaciens TaxID=85831 RepID=UPI0025AA1D69|nr:hypothetical protein [Bacteroides acidifaciens]
MILFVDKDTTLFPSSSIRYRGWLYRWTTLQPGITIVLAGARDAKQAIANAQSMDIHLSPDELQFINHELAKLQL